MICLSNKSTIHIKNYLVMVIISSSFFFLAIIIVVLIIFCLRIILGTRWVAATWHQRGFIADDGGSSFEGMQ